MPNYTWEETAERAALPGSLEQLVQYGVDFNKTMQYMELEMEMIRMQIQRIATAPADCTLLNRRIGYPTTP
ncbi:hypothetical protein [Bifidobacterium panos]|uniref:Uncharacterized protein n=1 Tax=Bifidobacterium panos TaxID=2675321 RepID=A0ABX1SZC0_9BIFI|nr:hypothetical protein [Bifidobacterium sp. DSM 109963]NMN02167.1 hypothetical protein [Bifidobacterium sp. DSM 109963]